MTIKKLTVNPTEADLEAEIHSALNAAFPWLKPEELKHQTRFSFKFGRSTIEVDGTSVSKAEARSDILIYKGDIPLAVLELKRKGVNLTEEDNDQGLSYARMLNPSPPLVVVTNSDNMRILATHTGKDWEASNPSEAELANLLKAVGKVAEDNLKHAVEILLGPSSLIWTQAVRASTSHAIEDLTGKWDDPLLPFVSNFLIPRQATEKIIKELKGKKRLVILNGPPLVGKSNALRELCLKTAADDDLVILFLESDGSAGNGVIQSLSNLLAEALGWSVSPDDTRKWLRRLSRASGPSLVLAIDGVGAVRDEVRRDIEELTSDAFGDNLKAVLAVDDTIVDRLILNETRRKATRIGRRSSLVSIGLLDNLEFQKAQEYLWNEHHIGIMKGGNYASELKIPWILRSLVSRYVYDQKYLSGYIPIIPPLLSLDLVHFVRERFEEDTDLRRQYHELAQAVLRDSENRDRPISLILESTSTFVVRQKTLKDIMAREDIASLEQRGCLTFRTRELNEFIYVPHLQELLLSEIALLLGQELHRKSDKDEKKAGDWLVARTAELPLGDLIGAQAILDYFSGTGHLSLDFISHLISVRPHRESIRPGTQAAMHVPGAGLVKLLFREDGSILANFGGHQTILEGDDAEPENMVYADVQSWLILSHLSRYPLLAHSQEDGKIIGRIDPAILMEIGTCKMVLRRPSESIENNGFMTHDLPEHGSMVCHKTGIIEPITMAILQFLGNDESMVSEWIEDALERNSFPLISRIHIALEQLKEIDDAPKAEWAAKMISGKINPAIKKFPQIH